MAGALEETPTSHASVPPLSSSSSIPQLCCTFSNTLWCSHQARFTHHDQLSYLNQFTVRLRNYEGLENAWPQHASYMHAARA